MKYSKQNRRAIWFLQFENAVCEADSKHCGKIDWHTATYLFNTGRDALDAARQYVENRKTD